MTPKMGRQDIRFLRNRLVFLGLMLVISSGLGNLAWLVFEPASAPLAQVWASTGLIPGEIDPANLPDNNTQGGIPSDRGKAIHRETINLIAAGDILMHNTEIWSGEQADGTYKFDFFGPVQALISSGDYASADFEAALAGSQSGYTGYPLFNSPDEMAMTMRQAGFNLIVTANNHVLDRGIKGALRTLQVLRGAGLDTLGVYSSQTEADSFLIKNIRGVKVGYLAYTYGSNGIPLPKDYPYLVNLLDKQRVLGDIARIRPQVDFLVLVLHWGNEYQVEPTAEQKTLASDFLAAGADVILGSHPHVVGPMQVVQAGAGAKVIAYSLGNFIGDQHGVERNSGVILNIKVTKDFQRGKTFLSEVSYIPTFSQSYYENGRKKFRVVSVTDSIRNIQEGKDPYFMATDLPILEKVLASTTHLLGSGYRQTGEKDSANSQSDTR